MKILGNFNICMEAVIDTQTGRQTGAQTQINNILIKIMYYYCYVCMAGNQISWSNKLMKVLLYLYIMWTIMVLDCIKVK